MKRKGTVKLLLGIAVVSIFVGIVQLTAQDKADGDQDQRRETRGRMGMGGGRGGQMGMMRQQPTPVMIQDDKYIYICLNDQVFKIDKTTFKMVSQLSLPKPQRGGPGGQGTQSGQRRSRDDKWGKFDK